MIWEEGVGKGLVRQVGAKVRVWRLDAYTAWIMMRVEATIEFAKT